MTVVVVRRTVASMRHRRHLPILLVFAVAVSGCGLILPPGASDQSRDISSLYSVFFVVAVAVFLFVEGLLVYSLVRYRRRPGDDELPRQIHGNNLAEALWTLIPLVLAVGLFVLSWQTLNRVEARSPEVGVTVDVTAFQFQWQFDYATEQVTVFGTQDRPAEMVLPIGEVIRINLTSSDVIHAFYVPALNYKKDAVPGRVTSFDFTLREPGTYRGQCAELCGIGHYQMLLTVRAVPRAEFDDWVRASAEPAVPAPPASAPAPSGTIDATPGGSATPSTPASASDAPTADTVRIGADASLFDSAELVVPADRPFSLVFENREPIPHNVAIYTDASAAQAIFVGEIFPGPAERPYAVPPIPAGTYFFRCDVHPVQMTGTVTAR